MNFDSQHSAPGKPRYAFLVAFDLTLNFLLCCGVFSFACALLWLILSNNASSFASQMARVGLHIFS